MSNSILPAAGNLDIVNANVRADKFNAATNIGVANTNPDFNFSVADKFHVDKDSTDPVSITGNVVASGIKISNLTIGPAFDFASVSNVGNVTANVIQFANATTGFTTTANVEIGGNISLTSNAQVKVDSNTVAEYTGPHPRDPTTPLLKKYPEIAFDASKMDGNDTTNTYTQAGYTVTASSQLGRGWGSYRAFNHKAHASDEPGWATSTSSSLYDETTGQATSNATLFDGNRGEYIDLKLPHKIKVSHFTIRSRVSPPHSPNDHPSSGHLYGSDNGTNWVKLTSYSGLTYQGSSLGLETVTVNATEYYNHLRLTATARVAGVSGSSWVDIGELEYYGYEEPAPVGDLSLDTTLKSTFNSVRTNDYVMYFDGEDPTGDPVVPKYLPSGTVKTITPNNITFDASNNCWSLDGSTESNVTTADLGFEGDAPHTVSMWVNSSNLDANATTQQLFTIGSGYDKSFLKVYDTQIAANTWHNVTYTYQGEGGSKVTYVDGRKVEEEKVEDTFGDYPPFAMDDYEVGGYRVSASSELPHSGSNYKAWRGFDDYVTGNDNLWICAAGLYDGTGAYTGPTSTTVSGTAYSGEWLQIELPHKLKVNYVAVLPQNDTLSRAPKNGVFAGSNDGTTWNLLGSFTGITTTSSPAWSATVPVNFTLTSSTAYKYFRIIVTAGVSTSLVTVQNMQLYGHKEGDLTRFPEPTRVLKYPHIAMTGPGQRGYVASASTNYNEVYTPYKAFNNNATGNDAWITGPVAHYDNSNGGAAKTSGVTPANPTTTVNGDGTTATGDYLGQFLQIELPHKVKATKFRLASYTTQTNSYRAPKNGVIAGSNNGTTWDLLHKFDNQTSWTTGSYNEYAVTGTNANTYYKYFIVIVTSVNSGTGGDGLGTIHEFEILGTQEDTQTPAIVGGPFAGKVANFRVYDQYLGDERIQEIYDAQKDEFGHKKSSMTFYKGRIGVGTTEPEGALTVLDEPHALAKFPARAVSADDSYVEGDGQIKLSAAEGSGYQAFDGLTSTSWTAAPTRNTRLSEEVDFGAWLKMETPESISLKKAEFESNPDWRQVGTETYGGSIDNTTSGDHFGRAVACSHDGTRVIVGGYVHSTDRGLAKVYDWNGSAWTQVGQTLTGTISTDPDPKFGYSVAISGDGNIIAVAAPFEHVGGNTDNGTVRVYYLNAGQWTVLPDSGSLTESETGAVDAFVGETSDDRLGLGGVKLSYDGYTVAMGEVKDDTTATNTGRVRVYTYSNGAWSQKGSAILGSYTEEEFGQGLDMSEDGNHLIIGTKLAGGTNQPPRVEIYQWNGSAWAQKGSSLTYTDTGDGFGPSVSISNDGNTIGIGIKNADIAEGAPADNAGAVYVYHWNGSAWGTPHKLVQPVTDDDDFGGYQVMSGDGKRLIVGASQADDGGTDSGRLYTFEYTGVSWIMRTPGTIGADGGTNAFLGMGPSNAAFSHAISRDGSVIVAGESGYYTNGVAYSGRVRIYNMPSNIKSIWGSNDNENWTKITTAPTREEATSNVAGLAFGYDDRLEFKNLDNPNYYKYHAIVADAFTRLKDVKLFGVRKQGSSTLHDGALTLTKNLDVPRIGPALDADDTPRRDRLVVEYNTSTNPVEDGAVRDTSGRGNDGAFYGGASYNAADKALKFDGSNDNIETDLGSQIFKNSSAHTTSLWVRLNEHSSDFKTFFSLGNGVGNPDGNLKHMQLYHSDNFGLRLSFTQHDYRLGEVVPVGQWVHVAYTYDGTTWQNTTTPTNVNIYINGTKVGITSVYQIGGGGGSALDLSTALLGLGASTKEIGSNSNQFCDCDISNFKLYDTALTASEVKTLYDMGRCDEGHHVVNFSKTRVGIGLGDGEVPRGDLEVQGDATLRSRVGIGLTPSLLPDLGFGPSELVVHSDGKASTDITLQSNLPYDNTNWTRSKSRIFFRGNGGFTNGDNQNNWASYIRGGFRDGYNSGANWSNSMLSFHTKVDPGNEVEAMTITNGGKVGVGTDAPEFTVDVPSGTLNSRNYKAKNGSYTWGFGIGSSEYYIYGGSNGVTGVYMTWGSTSWIGHTSDERRKKNLTPINDALQKIRNVRPVLFHFNHEEDTADKRIGFIAQDWLAAQPECVYYNESADALTMSLTETTPFLCAAIKELDSNQQGIQEVVNNLADFTGQHRCLIKDIPLNDYTKYEGLIVSANNNEYLNHNGITKPTINEALPIVSLTNKEKDKTCLGVISLKADPESRLPDDPTRLKINSLGEGAIWVTNINGSLESGDYITSSNVAGYGMRQDDDIIHNYTIAKITQDCDFTKKMRKVKKLVKELKDVTYYKFTYKKSITKDEYDVTDESLRLVEDYEYYSKKVIRDINETTPGLFETDAYQRIDDVQHVHLSKEEYDENPSLYNIIKVKVQEHKYEKDKFDELKDDDPDKYEFKLTTSKKYYKLDKRETKEPHPGYETEVRQELVNVLDENGQLTWIENEEMEAEYDLRYLDADGNITDEANAVHKAAFVGCTYHCG